MFTSNKVVCNFICWYNNDITFNPKKCSKHYCFWKETNINDSIKLVLPCFFYRNVFLALYNNIDHDVTTMRSCIKRCFHSEV